MKRLKKCGIFLGGISVGVAFAVACGSTAADIINAVDVIFDNANSTLFADNVQDAIVQLDTSVNTISDEVLALPSRLTTTSQNVLGSATVTRRTAADTDGTVSVACDAGEVLTGGGCTCQVGSSSVQDSSGDASQNWNCVCDSSSNVTATAFCMATTVESSVYAVTFAEP